MLGYSVLTAGIERCAGEMEMEHPGERRRWPALLASGPSQHAHNTPRRPGTGLQRPKLMSLCLCLSSSQLAPASMFSSTSINELLHLIHQIQTAPNARASSGSNYGYRSTAAGPSSFKRSFTSTYLARICLRLSLRTSKKSFPNARIIRFPLCSKSLLLRCPGLFIDHQS